MSLLADALVLARKDLVVELRARQAMANALALAGIALVLVGLAVGPDPDRRRTLGAGVAVGWTPCIGPTLGAILAFAATAPTAGAGLVLLLAYAAGLAIPFLVVLFAMRRFRGLAGWLGEHRRLVDTVTGTLVAGVGVLVFTGAFARLAGLFTFGVV